MSASEAVWNGRPGVLAMVNGAVTSARKCRKCGRRARSSQRSADGHKPYLEAVEGALGSAIDYFMSYNFGRIHTTLRVTPAMEAGVADHVWSLAEIAGRAE